MFIHLSLYYSTSDYLSLPLSPHSSRLKNKMWYGLLGSKELLQRSYRKLEERIHLEVSGKRGQYFLDMEKGNLITLGTNFPLYLLFFPSFNSDPPSQLKGGRHEDRFPFYGLENDSMKRKQSPLPISVNVPSYWYLKGQPMRTTLFFQCDGEAISLPNLQGIVVLNITSYAGGVNFWGSSTATTVSMEQGSGKEKV